MGENSLAVEIRTETGKGFARKVRALGRVPAVLYGHGKETVSLTVNPKELDTLLRKSEAGLNTLIDLAGADEAPAREQQHPAGGVQCSVQMG